MKYLITGITGFVGPNLANYLIEKDNIVGLVRSEGKEEDIKDIVSDENYSKMKFLYGDLTDKNCIERIFKNHRFDGVFHLGAQSHPPTSFVDPEGTYDTNYNGTKNIVDSIKKHQRDCALMFCSTSEVYGIAKEQPISEGCPIIPMNPYGWSKALAETYVLGHANIEAEPFNLKSFATRAFSHTGLRRGNKFSISSDAYQLDRIKKGLQEPVISVGNLSSKRVIMDVKDCVRAYSMLMERALNNDPEVIGEAFNVGGSKLFSMRRILNHLLKISGLEGKVEEFVNPKFVRKIDIPLQVCNDTKLRKLTNWKPEIDIVKQTLPELLNYWEKKNEC
jgi:GDP-4-dehydro-6-deoxy-D-mannose reductase